MSVQNGERLATKQDLADMYQGILPYLGGMPEMLANKFSKGDLYSTDEKMIGQWIDGKPLYQCTIIKEQITADWNTYIKLIEGNFAFAKVVDCTFTNSDYTSNLGAFFNTNSDYVGYGITWGSTNIGIRVKQVGNNWVSNVIITLQYTKTTDSAISIGESTDYSTEEKIVGTWIDGKPIYQKTIQITLPTCVTEGVPVWDTLNLNFTVDSLIDIKGYFTSASFKIPIPFIMQQGNKTVTAVSARCTIINSVQVLQFYNSNPAWNGTSGYVTIQYTKTTGT